MAEGSDRTYVIPSANYGRSGGLGVENYNIEPSTFASTPLDIRSNEITLQIIPATSVWQAEMLRAAQSKLNEPASAAGTVLVQPDVDRQQAVAVNSEPLG